MKPILYTYLTLAFTFGAMAQSQSSSNAVTSVEEQLKDLQNHIRELESKHSQEIQQLKDKLNQQDAVIKDLQSKGGPGSTPTASTPITEPSSSATVATEPTTALSPSPAPSSSTSNNQNVQDMSTPWKPTDPITVAGGGGSKNYLNLSFDGLFAAAGSTAPDLQRIETGGHDPIQRGFTVQNLEITMDGAVDPYFTGQVNLVTQIGRGGDTTFEAEEAWLQSTSLPWNLQVKGGLFLSPFGRLNQTHPHTWDFADQPLVNGRLLGTDGLRNPGIQISYLTPLPWYSEIIAAVQNGSGSTAYSFRNRGDNNTFFNRTTLDREVRGPGDLLYVLRWANSIDLDDEQTVVVGTSAAVGPNDTGEDSSTQIYGVDAYYKWKPDNASGGWPFVKWQNEAMYRRYEAGTSGIVPHENFDDWGAYSQVVWGFSKGWMTALRGDYLSQEGSIFTPDQTRETRWRISPNLTYFPTEFSKIRLQYNHDDIQPGPFVRARNVETVILQFEFILGAHGAHKF